MFSFKSPKPVLMVRARNQLNNFGSTCSRRAIVKFLYTRGLLVLGLIACIVMLMQMSSFHPEPEPHAQPGINDHDVLAQIYKHVPNDPLAPTLPPTPPAWQGVCDLSTITNPTNLTTLVIMAYLNHDALMMVLSKYNDCRHFGGILHEIVRYRFTVSVSRTLFF